MRSSTLKIKKSLFAFCLLFCFYTASAQVNYDKITFRIDSLANVGLPKSALKEVDQLDALARKNNNAPQQIRVVIYRMTFESYLEENALTAVISRLKTDIEKADYPVKPVLQSLLAQMFWNYYQQNRYQFGERSRLEKPDTDFTKWDLQTIITETARLYDLSLHDAAKEQKTPIGVLDGVLEGDSTTRYLRPALYDLLVQRAFDFFLGDEPGLTKPRLAFSLNDTRFFDDDQTFAGLEIKTTDTASTEYKGIKYLQQATAFHLGHNDDEALADLDMQRLKFIYGRSNVEHKDSLYLAALSQIAEKFSAKPISSEALVMEGQYYQGIDSLAIAHRFFKKATDAYPEGLGGKNAAMLMKKIEGKEISATVEAINIPDKPLLALLSYKNLTSAKILVYKLSSDQMLTYNGGTDRIKNYNFNYLNRSLTERQKNRLEFLKQFNPVQKKKLKWNDLGDYKDHSLEFKMEPLGPGNYVLLVKDTISDDETLTGLTEFKITKLAYTARINPNSDLELLVMDRETGAPLSGVHIIATGKMYRFKKAPNSTDEIDTTESGYSNNEGLFMPQKIFSVSDGSIKFSVKGDTLRENSLYVSGQLDNSDDEPTDKTVLFADRQIYRPGQTIYFKGVQLQVLNGKSKIMPGRAEEVEFLDVNDKQVSLLKFTTNEFGTFSGSFIVPQNTLNGDMRIRTDDGEVEVKVEEYKRPSFQVEFLPLKESYKLNDSIIIKGTVSAFSGYGLSQAKVACHIVRKQGSSIFNNYSRTPAYNRQYRYDNEATELKTDTITTNDQGNFELKFMAIPGVENGVNYNYTITADVTDGSGETHSGEITVTIGYNDVVINSYWPDQLFSKDTFNGQVSIDNLNGQPQKGDIIVEIYSLKNPGMLFKNRVWSAPDQLLIGKTDFKKDFPDYAYDNEDLPSKWPRIDKVFSSDIKINGDKPGEIDLSALRKKPSGAYQVVIHAKNENGDTTSITKYIDLLGTDSKPSKFADLVIPVINQVRQGDTAEFLVGINEKVNLLMERYKGAKLISSRWLKIDKKRQSIKIPISDTDSDVAVQFMMIYRNRMYSSYQNIYISDPGKSLKIKLLTFHNKLQPGQKDEWKLQFSNYYGEKQSAEMLAGLYDASLDEITPAQDWKNLLNTGESYQPRFYAWESYNFIAAAETYPVDHMQINYVLMTRRYEHLNMFAYNYYGGYNYGYRNYLDLVKDNLSIIENDKKLEADYAKNATLVKVGYDINGEVIDNNDKSIIVGVEVNIKGTKIKTKTNSKGRFKMRVPLNAILTFSYKGYPDTDVTTAKGGNMIVKLRTNILREVTITGYLTQLKKDISGSVSVVTMRSYKSLGYNADTGDGADASMVPVGVSEQLLQGQASGVNVINSGAPGAASTVFIRGISSFGTAPQPITLRKNFNETAFFYPQLHTDEKGEIMIDFTIPEALTRWKFRALAHTKDLQTGYIENTVVTQKQLSITANTPRFLREGDTITISARLANLTAGKLSGKVQMQLFNALDMQPVELFVSQEDANQQFEVEGNTNKAISFKLAIPAGLDALTYRLTADAGEFTDGEENTLPVLPNRMLVTESMPMMVRAGQTRDFTFDKLVKQNSVTLKNKTLTLEYTANPAWYAVQALPYMMEFPYECSEQVFSRYYANSLATNIVTKMPAIKQVFDEWKATNNTELLSNLEKNQELKETLIEETPWLKDAENETEQKKRIALLFDLNKMSDELKLNLEKLQKRQLPDGGFCWFGGDRSDRYITQHIAEGIGELYHLGIAADQPGLRAMADNALGYLDRQLIEDDKLYKKDKDYATRPIQDIEIHAWFTRSYFLNKPMDKDLQKLFAAYLTRAASQWTLRNAYEQGMIALTMQRYKKPDVTAQIERSLLETAQQSDDLGMYWAKNLQGYFWYESPIETQSLLIELFTETGDNAKAVDEMKIWLLRNKQTNDWKTTKATAAACYALLLKGNDLLADTGKSTIKLDGKPLEELKPEVKADAGTGYIKTSWVDEQIKPAMGKVEIKNTGKNISWGALHWQYFENLDKITSAETNIKLERKYFIQKQTDAGSVLTAVDDTHQPKTGDLLKVVVYLKADRDFEYVQLKDMRPAGTEPIDALSEYKYQDGLYYYQVTKDVATNFFISYLNKGSYVFEYRLRVAQPGNFSTGTTNIQCMYAPEFNAHSQGGRMIIKL
jgi:uncharacterized protein YfaS (alpha-2-macroglobulin family)